MSSSYPKYFPKEMFRDGTASLPSLFPLSLLTLVPSQWMELLKASGVPAAVPSKGCWLVRALLCHHLGQMFAPIWTLWGFGVQSPAARWSCRRHCPVGQPSSNPFSKPLAHGASQSWCNPADLYSCCLFPPFFINSIWTSSQAVMDFVQLR